MDKVRDVAVIVGSLRKASINRQVANALAELAPAGLKLSIVEIGQLPIYNQDGDDNPPAEWTAFRERIRTADAVLFVTPEHNRSVPTRMASLSTTAHGNSCRNSCGPMPRGSLRTPSRDERYYAA